MSSGRSSVRLPTSTLVRVLLLALGAGVVTCDGSGAPADPRVERDAGAGDAASADAARPDADTPDLGEPDTPVRPGRPQVTPETYPRVDGSTSTIPLARLIACELLGIPYRWQAGLGEEGEAEIVPAPATPAQEPLATWIMDNVVHHQTHRAYLNVIDGTAELILVASLPSEEERAYAAERQVTLDARAIALDALVFLVNEENPTATLSARQLRDVFLGRIVRWQDVGPWAGDIHPYVRPPNSGSQQLMESLVMGGEVMPAWPADRTVGPMGALVDHIRADPLAIGFSVYYYVTYQTPPFGYRLLAIDGVSPVSSTLASRKYPYTAEVWVVVRDDLDRASTASQLRHWLLVPDGQQAVGRSGYVPVAP